MKKILVALFAIVLTLMLSVAEAQTRRLGGGRTIGKQSPTAAQQAPMQKQATPAQPAQAAKPAAPAPAPAPAPKPSMWKGLLGGALLGLGLGALLGHMGIGGAAASMISSILMIALLVFAVMFIYKLFTRKKEEDVQPMAYSGGYGSYQGAPQDSRTTYQTGYQAGGTPEIGSRLEPAPQASTYVPYGIPANFDVDGFLRSAKTYFIRLQASWDRNDVNDLREFTSPEMFAELKMQMQERGNTQSYTDVVTLDAELLGIENVGNEQMASVQFWGSLREASNAPAIEFSEIWNLTRPLSGSGGWVLAGIQNATS